MAKRVKLPESERGGLRARARGPLPDALAKKLADMDAMPKAVETLIELLDATVEHWSKAEERMVLEVDGQTRTKSAAILLAYTVGEPVKRQQILTGVISNESVDRTWLKETIDKKLASLVTRDDVTVSELIQAKKAMDESEKDEPSKLTPAERESEIARILGIE